MLVLPIIAAPAARQAPHRGRRVERPVPLEDARAGRRRHALRAEEVLDGERHAGERRPARPPGASSAVHRKAPSSPSSASMRSRVGGEQLVGATTSPARTRAIASRGGQRERARRSLARRGHAEAAGRRVGRLCEHALPGPARARLVRAQHVLDLDHVRRRRRRRRGRARRSSRCGRARSTARATCARSRPRRAAGARGARRAGPGRGRSRRQC